MKEEKDSVSERQLSEQEWLKQYDFGRYPGYGITVDPVIFTVRQGRLGVLLIRRGSHPFLGYWALPGGFKRPDEGFDVAAARELAEETGLTDLRYHLEQLGTYGKPNRDPRGPIVSVSYVALVPDLPALQAGSDADQVRFWAVEDVFSEEGPELAFDHAEILKVALVRARAKLEYTTVAAAFLDEPFTMSDLRHIYEVVWGVKLDPTNFRKQVLISNPGFVVETGEEITPSLSGGRPTPLFRRGEGFMLEHEIKRPRQE